MALTVDNHIQYLNSTLYAATAAKSYYTEVATGELSSAVYGTMYNRAIALLACHYYTLDAVRSSGSGAGGVMTAFSEGRASVQFATSEGKGSSSLNLTYYGQLLMALRKSLGPAATTTGGETTGYN